jgi:hypothetical protein
MLAEIGWLTGGMTVQLYVQGADGYLIALGMLAAYLVFFFRRVESCSKMVWLLSIGLALGSIGGLATGNMGDIFEPLHMGLSALTVMGGFVVKYNKHDDTAFIGLLIIVLMPVAIWQSVVRNNLLALWSSGSRFGVNLSALFLMIGATYGFLLKGWRKSVVIPFYVCLYMLGSRTGFITSLAFPLIYSALSPKIRHYLMRHQILFTVSLVLVFIAGWYFDLMDMMKADFLFPVGTERYGGGAVNEGADQRIGIAILWLKYLWEYPSLFGHGIDTYGAFWGGNRYPHNGLLHVFNGLGVICGLIYLWVIVRVMLLLLPNYKAMPQYVIWSVTFIISMLIRSFGEAQLLVSSIHIAGFAITYAFGVAIWAADGVGNLKRSSRSI